MARAEPTNTCTTGVDTCHSTMVTLLLELNVILYVGKDGYSSNGKIVLAELLSLMAKLHFHLANL